MENTMIHHMSGTARTGVQRTSATHICVVCSHRTANDHQNDEVYRNHCTEVTSDGPDSSLLPCESFVVKLYVPKLQSQQPTRETDEVEWCDGNERRNGRSYDLCSRQFAGQPRPH